MKSFEWLSGMRGRIRQLGEQYSVPVYASRTKKSHNRAHRSTLARRSFLEPLEDRLPLAVDFGDAPDFGLGTGAENHETVDVNNGPSHTIVAGLFLGAEIDGDSVTLQNTRAHADDVDGALPDVEDGVLSPLDLRSTVGAAPAVTLLATNRTGGPATLSGWIDYNQDGLFDNATERAQTTVPDGTAGDRFTLTFPTISAGSAGSTYARFRLSTGAAAGNPTGHAPHGEIEDYPFAIAYPSDRMVASQLKISDGLGGLASGSSLNAGDHFGSAVTSLGDLDGDGIVDLAVGARDDENTDSSEGAVYVLLMNPDGTVKRSAGGHKKISDGLSGLAVGSLDSHDEFGTSVTSLGDLDSDGVVDLAVGAPSDGNGDSWEGAVHVLMMNSDGTVKSQVKISDGLGGLAAGSLDHDDRFGNAVASLGDLDRDGVVDMAVGAYYDTDTTFREGAIYVLLMNSDGTVKSQVKISGRLYSPACGLCSGHFGSSLSNLGDLNGDGVIDLAVGASNEDHLNDEGIIDVYVEGAVYVLLMNSNGTVKNHVKIADGQGGLSAGSLDAYDYFGRSVAGLGDINGDGVVDLAVGAGGPILEIGVSGGTEGAVHVLQMNSDGTVKQQVKIANGLGGFEARSSYVNYSFGSSVAGLSDLDGDGVVDMVVGADKDGLAIQGAVYVLLMNSNGTVKRQVTISDGLGGLYVPGPTPLLSMGPTPNSHDSHASTDVTAVFDQNMKVTTATADTFVVHSMQQGQLLGSIATVSTVGNTVVLDPASDFFPGELVEASITSAMQGADGQPAEERVWQFRTAVRPSSGEFTNSGQILGDHDSQDVVLGDLDGDGDLDAFVTNRNQGNRIWVNQDGIFHDSGQSLGDHYSRGVALGDLDGDGDLDAFVTNSRGQGNRVWLNEGGLFSDSGQSLGDHNSFGGVSLGDLDGDGDLDAFIGNTRSNHVWLNDSDGRFTWNGQSLGNSFSSSVSLGDLDADGDLDAFVANVFAGNRVWLNDGGTFSDSGQSLGDHKSFGGAALGDLDGDGDLDAFVGNYRQGDRVWLNDGGVLTDSGQSIDNWGSRGIALGDLDGDGDLDALVAVSGMEANGSRILLNAGGVLEDSGQSLGGNRGWGVSLGDLDGDGDLDAFVVVNRATDTVWLNRNQHASQPFHVSSWEPTDSGVTIAFSEPFDASVLNLYETQSASVVLADVTLRGVTSGDVSGSLVIDPSFRQLTFIKTGGPLIADTYNLTLRSNDSGFKDAVGNLLDGDEDGSPGGDFSVNFVNANAAEPVTVSLPDLVRGPGQEVHVPAGTTAGIPIMISEGAKVRSAVIQIGYDPALLEISGVSLGAAMPAGTRVGLDTSAGGIAIVTLSSPADLPSGSSVLVNLQASVPRPATRSNYGRQQVLDLHNVMLTDASENLISAVADDAVHLVSYFADVSGNGRINAADAAQVAQVAALIDGGFGATPLTDPGIVGDVSGNGRINAADASLIAQFAALINDPRIPPIPAGAVIAAFAAGVAPSTEDVSHPAPVPASLPYVGDSLGFPVPFHLAYSAVDRTMARFDRHIIRNDAGQALEEIIGELLSEGTGGGHFWAHLFADRPI